MHKAFITTRTWAHFLFCAGLIMLTVNLVSCSRHDEQKKITQKIITISAQSVSETLYFSGTIQPISRTPVLSPIEGTVSNMYFKYGHDIKTKQALFTINSPKQQSNFQNALTGYLKAKQTLDKSKADYQNTNQLFNQGLESRDNLEKSQNDYYLNRLAFVQAKASLKTALKYRPLNDVSKLKITDVEKVGEALGLGDEKSEEIKILAPRSGVALFSKNENDSDGNGKVQTGSQIKEGQVLLYLGDLNGLATKIKVNEMSINKLHLNQKAALTSIAFPNITLHGQIVDIDSQATSTNDSSPIFIVNIAVPKLTIKQKKVIRVGMSTKIAISIQNTPEILVPLSAVSHEDNRGYVKIIDEKTNKPKKTAVTIGATTLDAVIITSGLKSGDKIVAPY